MKHTDEYGRRLALDLEELTVTDTNCNGEDTVATVALPDGPEGLPLLRSIMSAMALDLRYDLVEKGDA